MLSSEVASQSTEKRKKKKKRLENEIKDKCHPATIAIATAWKESVDGLKSLGPNPVPELVTEISQRLEIRLAEIDQRYSGPIQPPPGTFSTDVIFTARENEKTTGLGILEFLHWERHKIPLWKDQEEQSSEAVKRTSRTIDSYAELYYDRRKPKPFKGDLEHSNMFAILWDFGLKVLTPEALAYFFDEYCPCGAKHNPANLKEQRARFLKDLRRAFEQNGVTKQCAEHG